MLHQADRLASEQSISLKSLTEIVSLYAVSLTSLRMVGEEFQWVPSPKQQQQNQQERNQLINSNGQTNETNQTNNNNKRKRDDVSDTKKLCICVYVCLLNLEFMAKIRRT